MDDEGKNYHDPEWLPNRTISTNYRPITCLLMMWKILTAQIKKKSIIRLNAADYSRKDRKDSTIELKEYIS